MPLDSLPQHAVDEIVILDRMAELLATPDRWGRGALKKVYKGQERFCLVGALREVAPYSVWPRAHSRIERAMNDRAGASHDNSAIGFNDKLRRRDHPKLLRFIAEVRAKFTGETDAV